MLRQLLNDIERIAPVDFKGDLTISIHQTDQDTKPFIEELLRMGVSRIGIVQKTLDPDTDIWLVALGKFGTSINVHGALRDLPPGRYGRTEDGALHVLDNPDLVDIITLKEDGKVKQETVVITVPGGVASVEICPPNIEVVINDYDLDEGLE